MSITITTDVFCDCCGEWTAGTTGPDQNSRGARELARMAGWIRTRDKSRFDGETVDLCPECQDKKHEEFCRRTYLEGVND